MPDIAGVYSATQNSTLTPTVFWLKDPTLDTNNLSIVVEEFRKTPRETVGVFDGIGRTNPAFTSDGNKGWQIDVTTRTEDKAAHDKLVALLATGRILLLQHGAFPEEWYVKLAQSGDWSLIKTLDPTGTYRVRHMYRMSFTFITADVP